MPYTPPLSIIKNDNKKVVNSDNRLGARRAPGLGRKKRKNGTQFIDYSDSGRRLCANCRAGERRTSESSWRNPSKSVPELEGGRFHASLIP